MTGPRLYALSREGYEYHDQILYFSDRGDAMAHMARFVIESGYGPTAAIYVYGPPAAAGSPMALLEMIHLPAALRTAIDAAGLLPSDLAADPSRMFRIFQTAPASAVRDRAEGRAAA